VPAGEVVSVRMLGRLELAVAGCIFGPRELGGVKPKQLLEILLLERDRTVPKERLADLLWGDRLPQRVAATIETYVSVLRRALGGESGLGRRLILTDRGGYRLDAELVDVDVDRFEALLRSAAASDGSERRGALEIATALGRAELLADEPYADWVTMDREHYRACQVQALIELAECCLALDDPRAALSAADRALALERTSERAYRAAMLAHVALGDRDGALRAHARCRAALSEELGVSPAAETTELHVAILREEHTSSVSRLRAALPIAYADNGGSRIAYQVVGDGPVDLVFSPSSVTNLGATWDDPTYAAFLRRLASMGRLILFDKRGTGLSDPALDSPTTRERSDDLLAVLDSAGSAHAVLFGVCGGGALGAQFAADHPERTAGLILHNATARMLWAEDYPWGWSQEKYAGFLAGFEEAWLGNGEGQVRRNPGLAHNPRYCDWFARYVRLAANPWMARRVAEMNAELDVRDALGAIRAPCLVICATDDVWLSPENSRYLARNITGARLLELSGVDHDPWIGDSEPVLEAVEDFVGAVSRAAHRAGQKVSQRS
jgi:DNA-binding SARP family transcriptional activator/pimeloyl-ACP methyl ester carboxylesterase